MAAELDRTVTGWGGGESGTGNANSRGLPARGAPGLPREKEGNLVWFYFTCLYLFAVGHDGRGDTMGGGTMGGSARWAGAQWADAQWAGMHDGGCVYARWAERHDGRVPHPPLLFGCKPFFSGLLTKRVIAIDFRELRF